MKPVSSDSTGKSVSSKLADLETPDARSPEEILRENFVVCLNLFADGVEMKRESLKRMHPKLEEKAIDALLLEWLGDRPLDGPEPYFRPR